MHRRTNLSSQVIAQAVGLVRDGETMRQVARRLGIGLGSVWRAVHGQHFSQAENIDPAAVLERCPTCGGLLVVRPCMKCEVERMRYEV